MRAAVVPALLAAFAVALAARAEADRADVAYCIELSHLYMRYLGSPEDSQYKFQASRDPEARWAMSRCQAGDPGPAIPVLERKLTDGKVTLPPRR